jgi:hypothetical protein
MKKTQKKASKKPMHKAVKRTAAEVQRDHEVVAGVAKQSAKQAAAKLEQPKKSQPIMRRLPEVVVEYDFRKDGKVERRQKHFADANQAKRFFLKKDIKGKNPKVLKTEAAAQPKPKPEPNIGNWTTVEFDDKKKTFSDRNEAQSFVDKLNAEGRANGKKAYEGTLVIRKATLAEAFPSEPVNPDYKPQLKATGDPTQTTAEVDGKPIDEEAVKAEAKKKAKQLKRKHKKGTLLWKQADTKTIVGAKWQKPEGAFYDRWLIKYADGTEIFTSQLSIVHSREHEDHHLRISGVPAIDELSNKQYEEVLRRSAQYAQQQANRYKAGLTNFRASKPVQKEMEKRISKKALKLEAPLTPAEIELAKKLAETANFYATTVSVFFKAEADRLKNPHTSNFTDGAVAAILAKAEINPLACSIRIIQYAQNLANRMVPRIVPGGPQIGTPELAKQHEADKDKKPAMQVVASEGGTTTAYVAVKQDKRGEVDVFGNRIKSGKGKINAEILAAKPGTLFTGELIDKIDLKTIQTKSRTRRHFKKLAAKGFLQVVKNGYRLPDAAGAGNVAKADSKPAKAKAAAKASKAKKEPAKPARKAKVAKAKAAKQRKRG